MASSITPHPATTLSSTTTIPLAITATRIPPKNPSRSHRISCKSTDNNQESSSSSSRRNLLVGLGGLYGANTLSTPPFSFAGPIEPDRSKCSPAYIIPDSPRTEDCCPPKHEGFIDFKLPEPRTTLRVRQAAHNVDGADLVKFKEAMDRMRRLPVDDPRNFMQQANVHCAYCDGAYDQLGFPDLKIDVHSSWLFFPFHRCYLYFFERILGKLIDDPNFAMPYWNWDSPPGMTFPTIYTDRESPLYDPRRDALHLPPAVVDLSFNSCDNKVKANYQINTNLFTMHRQMVWNSKTATLFFGNPYQLGHQPEPGAGSIEQIPHNTVHNWTGDSINQPNGEDMGIFYSAARDPVFYAHHSNVDRMWTLWETLKLGKPQKYYEDPDFLDAAFYFYDENKKMVRIKVRDCLDNTKLGYEYEKVDIPWTKTKPQPRVSRENRKKLKKLGGEKAAPTDTLPAKLDRVLKIMVKRPKKNRSRKEKEEMAEILVIKGIELKGDGYVKFDVYINDDIEDDKNKITTPENTEFAGSFVHVPHRKRTGEKIKTQLRLSITDILEELGNEDDDHVMVTLVLTAGGAAVMIHGIEIELGD